jgi:hypothetical protein
MLMPKVASTFAHVETAELLIEVPRLEVFAGKPRPRLKISAYLDD